DRNRSHWSTSKTPSYTKSVSWQHHLTLDEINNTYCNNDYYNQAIREEPIDLLDRSFSSSSWPF
ncbi:hypothetical protein MZE26_20690, partial [Escherichia coli]|nr:hypothetical protein [Escherichia coli]MCK2548667.1 hypothetical protein [Escherichia coli]